MASSPTPNDDEVDKQFEEISKQLGDLADIKVPDDQSADDAAGPSTNPLAALLGGAGAGSSSPFGQLPAPMPPSRVAADIIKAQGDINEQNVDPTHRVALDSIARVAELHVTTISGLDPTSSGAPARLVAIKRTEWVDDALAAVSPLIDLAAKHLTESAAPNSDIPSDEAASALTRIMAVAQSMMVGALVGQTLRARSHTAFGRYDLLLPRTDDTVGIVTQNVASFASGWSLDREDLLLRTAINQLTHHAVLSVPHISALVSALIEQHVSAFEPDPTALERHLSQLDAPELSDPSQMLQNVSLVFNNLGALLGVASPEDQRNSASQLEGLLALVVAYANFVCDAGGSRLMRSYAGIDEAFARHSLDADDATNPPDPGVLSDLLAADPSTEAISTARSFVDHVVNGPGNDALTQMWRSLDLLPKPDELNDPQRWVKRYESVQ